LRTAVAAGRDGRRCQFVGGERRTGEDGDAQARDGKAAAGVDTARLGAAQEPDVLPAAY
jgi:hypothetical protein